MNSDRYSIMTLTRITGLVVLLLIAPPGLAIQSAPIIQQRTNMRDTALSIITEIKKACQIMVSEHREITTIIPIFGTPAKDPMNKYDLDPFNPHLISVTPHTSYAEPLLANTIGLEPKFKDSISILELKQTFGEYYHLILFTLSWHQIVFEYKPPGTERFCLINVTHSGNEKGPEHSITGHISVSRGI
jgi:hypothetical protein